MHDNHTPHQDRLRSNPHLAGRSGLPSGRESDTESVEASCAAFGYLRGIRERADAVEFRLRDGNSVWFPYTWLGTWHFNPSEGLLLKFSGDLIYLVLIRGSALDKPLGEGNIDLIRAGLQRHRVLWVREMTQAEIQRVAESGPTIDSIAVGEFESHTDLKEWLRQNAPAFLP